MTALDYLALFLAIVLWVFAALYFTQTVILYFAVITNSSQLRYMSAGTVWIRALVIAAAVFAGIWVIRLVAVLTA